MQHSATKDPIIKTELLCKNYILDSQGASTSNQVLFDINIEIFYGEFVAIMGHSGSGKSTLMNIMGCLDTPSSGRYWLSGQDTALFSNDTLAKIRNQKIGFVFQGFNLLKRMNTMDNVATPLLYAGVNRAVSRTRALEQLQLTGLEKFAQHLPTQLSGGQQQRAAISRALINKPQLILADEPTGNLDTQNSHEIMSLFQQLNLKQNITIIVVTHDNEIATYAKRLIYFRDGRITRDEEIT